MTVTEFDPPERFVAGTVGPPGERVFFLQAAGGARTVTVSLEKQQVQLLGERMGALLDEVAEAESSDQAADTVADNAPLDTPIEDDFRVQTLRLMWDAGRRVVVVEALEEAEEDDTGEPGETGDPADRDPSGAGVPRTDPPGLGVVPGQVLRVVLGPAQARAFTRRCASTVAGGRPSCPFCGGPIDAAWHICPRANGYKR